MARSVILVSFFTAGVHADRLINKFTQHEIQASEFVPSVRALVGMHGGGALPTVSSNAALPHISANTGNARLHPLQMGESDDLKWNLWPEATSPGPAPVVSGMGLAMKTLRNDFEWQDWLAGKPLGLIARAMDGDLQAVAGEPLYKVLQRFYREKGPIYQLNFEGFKSFTVVSDPVMVKHILTARGESDLLPKYDKGILAEILEDIMGNGLIPAKNEIWKKRRQAIAPGFSRQWLNGMLKVFERCNSPLIEKLSDASQSGKTLKMESEFTSVTLDIIGKSVFNYEFGSVTKESPAVKAVYNVLQEAERRSTAVVPYWKIPYANKFIENVKNFESDMGLLNSILDTLIQDAFETQEQADEDELVQRDYENMENPSLLRFLVDKRGEEASSRQLRDDLMTMLIAGHETTAAVLTWTMYELTQQPELYAEVVAEIDEVLGGRTPTMDDVQNLKLLRLCIAETLRMYPEPPLLLRRALEDDVLPKGGAGGETAIAAGTDVLISVWNMHRSPLFWEEPDKYKPSRFLKEFKNPEQPDWAGYSVPQGGLYPTELNSDYAFMPFGGGSRRCVGDQFATLEALATLCTILQRFNFALATDPQEVGMVTGATIHTANGLPMRITERQRLGWAQRDRYAM